MIRDLSEPVLPSLTILTTQPAFTATNLNPDDSRSIITFALPLEFRYTCVTWSQQNPIATIPRQWTEEAEDASKNLHSARLHRLTRIIGLNLFHRG